MAYKVEVTDLNGNVIRTEIFADHEIWGALAFQFGVDKKQINFAFEVLHVNPKGLFDLSIVEETDNEQKIVWTARLSRYTGVNNYGRG